MNTYEIEQQIESLPNHIKNAIRSFNWVEEAINIVQKHHLQIDEVEAFKKVTLGIATGLLPAQEYKNRLAKEMGISNELAGDLVLEANQTIFSELQKRAFSKNNNPEKEYENISNTLQDNGVKLIDEEEIRPKTKLQNITDELLGKKLKTEIKAGEKEKEIEQINQKTETEKKPVQYQEPIELSDLAGITKHRIPYVHHESKLIPENNLSKQRYTKPFISKQSSLDLSPSENEQISERGDFLKHIGATSNENQ